MDVREIERLARAICDTKNGPGHYAKPGTHRAHWRGLAIEQLRHRQANERLAYRQLKRAPRITMAEAFMAVFGRAEG
jgi:hypothetical protein